MLVLVKPFFLYTSLLALVHVHCKLLLPLHLCVTFYFLKQALMISLTKKEKVLCLTEIID